MILEAEAEPLELRGRELSFVSLEFSVDHPHNDCGSSGIKSKVVSKKVRNEHISVQFGNNREIVVLSVPI